MTLEEAKKVASRCVDENVVVEILSAGIGDYTVGVSILEHFSIEYLKPYYELIEEDYTVQVGAVKNRMFIRIGSKNDSKII